MADLPKVVATQVFAFAGFTPAWAAATREPITTTEPESPEVQPLYKPGA